MGIKEDSTYCWLNVAGNQTIRSCGTHVSGSVRKCGDNNKSIETGKWVPKKDQPEPESVWYEWQTEYVCIPKSKLRSSDVIPFLWQKRVKNPKELDCDKVTACDMNLGERLAAEPELKRRLTSLNVQVLNFANLRVSGEPVYEMHLLVYDPATHFAYKADTDASFGKALKEILDWIETSDRTR